VTPRDKFACVDRGLFVRFLAPGHYRTTSSRHVRVLDTESCGEPRNRGSFGQSLGILLRKPAPPSSCSAAEDTESAAPAGPNRAGTLYVLTCSDDCGLLPTERGHRDKTDKQQEKSTSHHEAGRGKREPTPGPPTVRDESGRNSVRRWIGQPPRPVTWSRSPSGSRGPEDVRGCTVDSALP